MRTKTLSLFILIVLTAAFLPSCKEEDNKHPEIKTLEATALSAGKVLFKGEIVQKGSFPVKDFGFIYGDGSYINEQNGLKISMGNDPAEGVFSREVTNLLINGYYGNTVYVRAYLTNEKGTAYGGVIQVNLPTPTVSVLQPSKAKAGELVTINGELHVSGADEVRITFDGTDARIVEAANSKIVVEVPTSITKAHNSEIQVALHLGQRQFILSNNFKIMATVTDFYPKTGSLGTQINFTGKNMPGYYYYGNNDLKVYLNDMEVSSYSDRLVVNIPATISSPKVRIAVVINGVRTQLPGEFTVTEPTVTSLSRSSGLPGDSFQIEGTGFQGVIPIVKLGNNQLYVSSMSSSSLSVAVPEDMPTGNYKLTVTLGPHTVEAPMVFTVLSPSIDSFSPSRGAIGTPVEIKGTFSAGQYYEVSFGSATGGGSAQTNGTLTVNVPYGASQGKANLSVRFGSQKATANKTFEVIGPNIQSFSPSSGVAGTVVTIKGEGFQGNFGPSTVKFGTVATTVLSTTATEIKALVPSNVNPGAMKISVVTAVGQTVVSDDNFTITNQ